jgi:IPT/TIG domain
LGGGVGLMEQTRPDFGEGGISVARSSVSAVRAVVSAVALALAITACGQSSSSGVASTSVQPSTSGNPFNPTLPTGVLASTTLGPPVVNLISPNSGAGTGGETVTITGRDFIDVEAVDFGNTRASDVNVNGLGTLIMATSPGGSGAVYVTVVTPVGASPPGPADQFTYLSSGVLTTPPTTPPPTTPPPTTPPPSSPGSAGSSPSPSP